MKSGFEIKTHANGMEPHQLDARKMGRVCSEQSNGRGPEAFRALVCLISLIAFASSLEPSDLFYAEAHKHAQGTSMHMPVVFGKQLLSYCNIL